MAKAVLVMDMPESCASCKLVLCIYDRNDYQMWCPFRFICHGPKPDQCTGKPDWCPLIPEPEREDTRYMTEDEVIKGQDGSLECYSLGHIDGWNDCLDALEGKT